MNEEQRGRLIKAFIDARRYLQQIASQGELSQGEFLVLRRIRIESEGNTKELGGFKAMRISQYLSMPPSAVSRIFNTLEGKGLIQRQLNKDNRRSVIITLTDNGKKALAIAEARVRGSVDSLIAELGNEDCKKLLTLLEKAIAVFARERLLGDDDVD